MKGHTTFTLKNNLKTLPLQNENGIFLSPLIFFSNESACKRIVLFNLFVGRSAVQMSDLTNGPFVCECSYTYFWFTQMVDF